MWPQLHPRWSLSQLRQHAHSTAMIAVPLDAAREQVVHVTESTIIGPAAMRRASHSRSGVITTTVGSTRPSPCGIARCSQSRLTLPFLQVSQVLRHGPWIRTRLRFTRDARRMDMIADTLNVVHAAGA